MASLGVDSGNDPVWGYFSGDLPGAVVLLLDVLTGHQGQESECGAGLVLLGRILERCQEMDGIVDQPIDEGRLGHRVVPGDQGFASGLVVVGTHTHVFGSGNEPANPADGGDQLGHGVLGGNGVVEQRRVEGSFGLAFQHPGGIDDRTHRVEDPFGVFGLAQPGAPIGQDREVEPLVVERQPAGHLPADSVSQRPSGITVGESFEGLENHDRGHHVGRDRRATTTGGEQVLEHRIGKQIVTVIGQERLDTSLGNQLTTKGCGVEQLRVGFAVSLHPPILDHPRAKREH